MIVDTSAILAIILQEADAAGFETLLSGQEAATISAANWFEGTLRIDRTGSADLMFAYDRIFNDLDISIAPVTFRQAELACKAHRSYGKGNHPAGLNFGDCFAYALAKDTGRPLLFKGRDFSQTDIIPARA